MADQERRLNTFPVFMRVENRAVVVIGNGEEALAKCRLIAQSSAVLRVVADAPEAAFGRWIADNGAEHIASKYAAAHLKDAALVFAATGQEALDRRIVSDAGMYNIPANAVDRPELCDFYTPALVNRAPVAVAIGTEGAGPVLAQMIRARIDRMLAPSLGAAASLAASYRIAAEKLLPRGNARRRFWKAFFQR